MKKIVKLSAMDMNKIYHEFKSLCKKKVTNMITNLKVIIIMIIMFICNIRAALSNDNPVTHSIPKNPLVPLR